MTMLNIDFNIIIIIIIVFQFAYLTYFIAKCLALICKNDCKKKKGKAKQ